MKYEFEMNGYIVEYREMGNEVDSVYVFDGEDNISANVNISEYEDAAQKDFNDYHREG